MQQAGGLPSYIRDKGHIEKAFDFNANAARAAMASIVMVQNGFTGADDPLSSPYGFYDVFTEQPDPDQLTEALGERFEILGAQIKRWPVGNPNQTPIESLRTLVAEHGISADDVERVHVQLPHRRFDIATTTKLPDVLTPHLLAVLLIDGTMTFENTHDASRMNDPAVLALRERIEVTPNADLDKLFPKRPAIVEVTMKDGTTVSHQTDASPGTPYNPMSREEVADKATDLIEGVLGAKRCRTLIERIFDLEKIPLATDLRHLLQSGISA